MWGSGVTAVMLTLECLDVGMNTVNKAAISKGLSHYVLVLYSNIIGTFLLLSSSCIFYRKREAPALTKSIICRIFLLSMLSFCGQVFTYIGIGYSSPTLASAMIDLTPAFTFILGVVSRLERLDWRIKTSQAKSIGTLVLIAGGLVFTLYRGLPLTDTPLSNKSSKQLVLSSLSDWVTGGFFLAVHSLILALVYIVQTWIITDFPSVLMTNLINVAFVSILSTVTTLITVKDPEAWRIKPDIKMVSIGFTAAVAVSLRSVVHTWACHKKGPVYTSMFKPMGMVIAVFLGVSFLGDTLYLGSVIGAIIIAFGFYGVMWGKKQEEKIGETRLRSAASNRLPLKPLLC